MKRINPNRLLRVGLPALAAAAITSGSASAATVTVCPSGCAFSQIAPAITAASPGDTIKVAAGTYVGGFTIDKSLKLVGAGAGSTIVSGGGPVITVGTAFADSEPTVSISGVTITGGVNHSSFLAQFIGDAIAVGGGISVPPSANFGPGATVSIANSFITGNKAEPLTALDSGLQCPPDITITCINGDLPFAQAAGGGINTFGPLTLTNTTVSDNQVGGNGVASDVGPGGITGIEGALTLKNSTVTDNRAIASAPNGRFAETGGVSVFGGMLTVDDSRISDNSAILSTAMPNDIPDGTDANAGGIEISGDDMVDTIRDSTISGNSASAMNSLGDANAFCGGICGGGNDLSVTISDSVLSGNALTATTTTGIAHIQGAGFGNFGALLTIRDTTFDGNSGTASGPGGSALGGAIWSGSEGTLTLLGGSITHNALTASTAHGGGLFTAKPATIKDTVIAFNTPDQCFGC
jgi:hypothetical protein